MAVKDPRSNPTNFPFSNLGKGRVQCVWLVGWVIRHHDLSGCSGQHAGHPSGHTEPGDANCKKCIHSQSGCIRFDAMFDHHAIDFSRDTVYNLAGKKIDK